MRFPFHCNVTSKKSWKESLMAPCHYNAAPVSIKDFSVLLIGCRHAAAQINCAKHLLRTEFIESLPSTCTCNKNILLTQFVVDTRHNCQTFFIASWNKFKAHVGQPPHPKQNQTKKRAEDFSLCLTECFLFTWWISPPEKPQLPSSSFPGSFLQARGGRVLLHVSPEMSHTHAHEHERNTVFPAPLQMLTIYFARRWGHTHACRNRKVRASHPLRLCMCVCLAFRPMGVAPCVCECVMRCVMWRRHGCLLPSSPEDLPHAAPGHTEEADYLVAASHSAQIKTKASPANEQLRLSKWSHAPFSSPGVETCFE